MYWARGKRAVLCNSAIEMWRGRLTWWFVTFVRAAGRQGSRADWRGGRKWAAAASKF